MIRYQIIQNILYAFVTLSEHSCEVIFVISKMHPQLLIVDFNRNLYLSAHDGHKVPSIGRHIPLILAIQPNMWTVKSFGES